MEWFNNSGLSVYNVNQMLSRKNSINDISNAISLRWDVHKAFDDKKFVLVPKEDKWVIHFLAPTKDLGRLYHNTEAKIPSNLAITNLLVRFAWLIFHSLKLLDGLGRRRLRLRIEENGQVLEVSKDVELQDWHIAQARSVSRSASPKKRRHVVEDDEEVTDSKAQVEHRGRKRQGSPYLLYGAGDDGGSMDLKEKNELGGRKRRLSNLWLDGGRVEVELESGSDHSKKRRLCMNEDELVPSVSRLPGVSPSSGQSTREDHRSDLRSFATVLSTAMPLQVMSVGGEVQNVEDIKLRMIKMQRPTNPKLLCCDYEAADAAVRAGRMENSLCQRCLGFNFYDDRLDDFSTEEL